MRAFTLVELIMVMTLIVVVIGLAAPTLARFFRGRSVDSEARRLLALTRQGQSRAASEGVPMNLWLDAKGKTYGLEREASYEENDPKAVEFTLEPDLRIELVNVATATATSPLNTAPGGMATASAHHNLPAIRFLPDGAIDETSPQAVTLFDKDGSGLSLTQSRNRLNYEIQNQNAPASAAQR